MFAPSHTLLLITSRVLARVDLSGRPGRQIQNVWVQPCTDSLNPTAAAAAAWDLGPRRKRRLWVLSSDFWTGVLNLPADVSTLLSANERNQALALEAEIESGISAFASRVGALRLAEPSSAESRWWVTHVSTAELQDFTEALKHSGAHLAGVAHPAAAQISEAVGEGLANTGDLVQDWDARITAATDTDPSETRAAVVDWAERWTNCLVQTPLTPLIVRCDPKPQSPRQRMMTSAAMGLLATGACGIWHWHTQQRMLAADRAIAGLQERQSAQEATQRTLQTLETRVAKLRKETVQAEAQRRALESDLHRADRTHAQHNHRWLALLDAIAGSIDNQCWIQRLESQPIQTIVHGLAIDNAAAHRFASALEIGLQGSGWTVLPAETRSTEHRLVAFRIVLDASPGPVRGTEAGDVQLSFLDASPSAGERGGRHE